MPLDPEVDSMRHPLRLGGSLAWRRLLVAVCALGAVAVAVAGCGGGGGAAAPNTPAGFIPATAPLYVEASANADGPQWTQVQALAQLFPGYPQLIADIESALARHGIDFARDIKPLLGERAGLALESFADDAGVIASAQLAEGKEGDATALIQRAASEAGTPTPKQHDGVDYYQVDDMLFAVKDGLALMAESESALIAALDAHAAGADGVIAENPRYTKVIAQLPPDALGTLYVDVGAAVGGVQDSTTQLGLRMFGISSESALGLAATAQPSGVAIKAVGDGIALLKGAKPFSPTLLSHVPADALGYVGFTDLAALVEGLIQGVQSDPELGPELQGLTGQLGSIEDELGVKLDDLRALAAGEVGVVVTGGPTNATFPGIVAVLQQADGARAKRTLDTLRPTVRSLITFVQLGLAAGGGGGGSPVPEWRQVDLANGVTGWELPLSPEAGIVYGVDGDIVYIGTKPAAIRDVQAPAAPLSADSAFKAAAKKIPSSDALFLWANMQQILSFLDRLGVFRDDAELLQNLRPVQNAIVGVSGGATTTLDAFVTVR
jgi:uncharacterized protein DUF3352